MVATETIRLKQILDQKKISIHHNTDIEDHTNVLVCQRILGHKNDIPGAGQWRVDYSLQVNECWSCGLHNYSLIFWSENASEKSNSKYTSR
jgi:hypothetical protein